MNNNKIMILATKYITQGLVIAIAAFYLPTIYKVTLRKPSANELFAISLTAALTMFIIDYFSEDLGYGLRLGTGFTIGQKLVTLI